MNRIEIQNLLKAGIEAARAGDRARARELLLAVVQADERNEPAWLWLSGVLDDPVEQLAALENVLALNPRQPQALAEVEKLRRALGLRPAASPEPAAAPPPEPAVASDPPDLAPAARNPPAPLVTLGLSGPAEPGDLLADEDDPYQCAYCGRPTDPNDERCPHCGRGLLTDGPWHGGGYLYVSLIAAGMQVQYSVVQGLAIYLRDAYPRFMSLLPFAALVSTNVLIPAMVRVLLWVLVLFMLLDEAGVGYQLTALVSGADLVWAGVGYELGLLSPLLAGLNAALSGLLFLCAVSAIISRAQSRIRLRVVQAKKMEGHHALHRQALANARKGQWALAALHWQRAISRAPREPLYYKALGRAQARLGRYSQAVRSFRSGAELDPRDTEFVRLIEALRSQVRSS